VCNRHGAKDKLCSSIGCTNIVRKGGVCIRHGAKRKRCTAMKDVQADQYEEECAGGMEQSTILMI